MNTRTPWILLGFSLAVLTVVAAGAWYFAGWPGLTVVGALFSLASVSVSARLMLDRQRNQGEMERLAFALGNAEKLSPGSFRLGGGWGRIAQRFIDCHGSLASQLRELHAAEQKWEVALHVAQAAQRRAEAIVNSLSDAVLVTNSFGEILLANAEAERLFRFDMEKVRGKPAREVVGHAPVAHLIEHAVQRGVHARRTTEELSLAPNGRPHWYKMTTAALVASAGEHLGMVAVLRDITPEKAAQSRNAEFVSAVSHEIKTPLSSVKAYAEMLAEGHGHTDPATQQKFLEIIESQTDRMTRMLDSMLDLARIESGVVRLDKKAISLNDLIDSGVKLMQPAASDKNIAVETRLSSLYIGVEVDADMMSRVVMNLVSNAIKYTEPGGRIVVRSRMLQDRASFEVEDTGHGIPPEAMGKLFQKFYRVEKNSKVAPGTGLGLALVKHIVEEVHDGKVEVESEVQKGSTFRVLLPLHRAVAPAE